MPVNPGRFAQPIAGGARKSRTKREPWRRAVCSRRGIQRARRANQFWLSSPWRENIPVFIAPKSVLETLLSRPGTRGVSRSSRTWGWDAVDATASGVKRDCRAVFRERSPSRRRPALKRTAKPCGPGTRCWCQVGGGFASPTGLCKTVNSPTTVTRRIRRRGERGINRKTIAQGRSDAPADTCMLVCAS